MAMTKRQWSVSALAVEFGLDRRTVAKRIEGIPPCGQERGSPVWKLADVADALAGRTGGQAGVSATMAPPAGLEALARVPALDAAATLVMLQTAYKTPAAVAALAVASGASCAAAFALYRAAQMAMIQIVVEVSQECGIAPLARNPGASLFALDGFEECDWHRLAAITGEVVDLDGWQAAAVERLSDAA